MHQIKINIIITTVEITEIPPLPKTFCSLISCP